MTPEQKQRVEEIRHINKMREFVMEPAAEDDAIRLLLSLLDASQERVKELEVALDSTFKELELCKMQQIERLEAKIEEVSKRKPAHGSEEVPLEHPTIPMGELYHELIMAVGKKHEGETRHQTALRYILQAETSSNSPARKGVPDAEA